MERSDLMGQEKNFENRLKEWLQSEGIYPLGFSKNKMTVEPCGYYEKRWGGGYSQKGLPDMHIVVNGINIDVELKASNGRATELQKHNIIQINQSGSVGVLLFPDGFNKFKELVKGVKSCNGHIAELKRLKNALINSSCIILMK